MWVGQQGGGPVASYCGSFSLKFTELGRPSVSAKWGDGQALHLLATSGCLNRVHCQSLVHPLCKSGTQLPTGLPQHPCVPRSALPGAVGGQFDRRRLATDSVAPFPPAGDPDLQPL